MDAERCATMTVAAISIITFVGLAALMAVITHRGSNGALARNQWVGIRTPSTMRSDRAWIAGHGAAHRLTPLYAMWAAAAGAVLLFAMLHTWSIDAVMLTSIAASAVFVIVAVCTAVVAGRAAKAADDDAEHQR